MMHSSKEEIITSSIIVFKHVRLLRQTLQDLQYFTVGEVMFQIKYKWRFKLLYLVSELKFSWESVACVALSYEQFSVENTLVYAAGTCKEDLQQLAMFWHNYATQELFTSRIYLTMAIAK